ncbi:Uncharacterized SAM-dependent O-methyltransferase [hydrothermal vent metagenome]|uniref:Uncharacterized SAM-dependent O-methyltransferase n=1 Tax=hydrothermal vent metagenome TaxID=652676 RepID=A0A3B0WSY2_9ZZZZ
MIKYDAPDTTPALEAKFIAQQIAYGPVVFQAALALRDFGILEALRKNETDGLTANEVSAICDVSVYGCKVLLESGLSAKITRLVDDKFFITKVGIFLTKDKLTKINMNFVEDFCYDGFTKLKDSITEGRPAGLKTMGDWPTVYEALTSLNERQQKSWFEFDHYYSDIAFPTILPIVFANNPKLIMDIGANTGKFTLQCLNHDANVNVNMVDLPQQLELAKKNIENENLSDRAQAHGMNVLDEKNTFPSGADVIWMSQFLDCFSMPQIVSILKRAKAAMNENTTLYILELLWDRQEYEASAFCLHNTSLYFTCFANGDSQMYKFSDLESCIIEAGLKIVSIKDDIGISHTLLECKPA